MRALPRRVKHRLTINLPPGLGVPSVITDTGASVAIDFSALLDTSGRTHVGNADRNGSYFNYAPPVVAVGAGTVVAAVDRYTDQVPNHSVPVGAEAADGNHVIIKLAPGVFAGYAHLKPGSVRVHIGERVHTG